MKQAMTAKHGKHLGTVMLVAIGVILAITNPDQADYNEFATQAATEFLIRDLCHRAPQEMPELLGNLLTEGCTTLAQGGHSEIKRFIANNTQQQNFVFFSFYTTDMPIYQLRTIGIFRNFYIFNYS
jgi:hypothetical protein